MLFICNNLNYWAVTVRLFSFRPSDVAVSWSHTDGGGLHEPCVTVDTGSLIEPSLFQRILFGTAKTISTDGRSPCLSFNFNRLLPF